ncbi:hypothetical protein EUTSA_v10024143mg [Eutrema salsugineum]|uniref:Uncharacterized protein n=1 Tax=Eutrema salsugineum TaxID=72664 RepID=V4MDJ1_EUTSA|nr:hypothetical protein EUTSA_v10024143mg [Eutrema salsugineum]
MLTLLHSCPTRTESISDQLKKNSKGNNNKNNKDYGSSGGYFEPGFGSEPGTSFELPGFSGKDWGNVGGGYNKGGVVRPTVKLTCPAKCFKSFSRSRKGYGDGGEGGGCTIRL